MLKGSGVVLQVYLQSTDKHGREKLQLGLLIHMQRQDYRYRQKIHDGIRGYARDCVTEIERIDIDTPELVSSNPIRYKTILPVVFWFE